MEQIKNVEIKSLELRCEQYYSYEDYFNATLGILCNDTNSELDIFDVYSTIADKLWFNKNKKIYCNIDDSKATNICCSIYRDVMKRTDMSVFMDKLKATSTKSKNVKNVVNKLNESGWFYTF